jgi:hypothetical protein
LISSSALTSALLVVAVVFAAGASTLSDFLLLDTIHIMNLRMTFNRIAAIAALASPSLFAPGVFGVDPSIENVRIDIDPETGAFFSVKDVPSVQSVGIDIDPETGAFFSVKDAPPSSVQSVRIDPETGVFFSVRDVCGDINSSKCNTGGEDYSTISKTLSDAPLDGQGQQDMQALAALRAFVQGKCKNCVEACDLKVLCEARKPILKAIRDHKDKHYPDTARSFCGNGELSCGRVPIANCNTGGEKYGLIKNTLLEAPKTGGPKAQNAIADLRRFFVDETCANCIEDSTTEELCRDSDKIVQGIRDYDDANYVSGLGPYCKESGIADPANCFNPIPTLPTPSPTLAPTPFPRPPTFDLFCFPRNEKCGLNSSANCDKQCCNRQGGRPLGDGHPYVIYVCN